MADAEGFFVQFPHPAAEHRPKSDVMPWNNGEHRRKFLVSSGTCVDHTGRPESTDLAFWSEWEPPSRVEQCWPRSGHLPRWLHRPYWTRSLPPRFVQNTDPWVFGERMLYSNCKQTIRPQRRPTSMQRLTRGSVICFGSTIDGEFCLDTVFVIASAAPWSPAEAAQLDVDDAFKTCTVYPLARGRVPDVSLTLYRGATLDDPVEGMYSFVPARRADDPRFPRPALRLPGLINPDCRRSTWGSRRSLPVVTLREAWKAVREQVLGVGLVLAVRIETPQPEAEEPAVGESDVERSASCGVDAEPAAAAATPGCGGSARRRREQSCCTPRRRKP